MFIEVSIVNSQHDGTIFRGKLTINSTCIEQVYSSFPNKENVNAVISCRFHSGTEKFRIEEKKSDIDELLGTQRAVIAPADPERKLPYPDD